MEKSHQELGLHFPEDAFPPGSKEWWKAYRADLRRGREIAYMFGRTDEGEHAAAISKIGQQHIDLEDIVDEALGRAESDLRVIEFFGLV